MATIAGALVLMFWQLERAEYKSALMEDWTAAQVTDISLIGKHPALPQRVVANGRFDDTQQVLLDNQVRDFQTGVHVFTPFITDDRVILVNRGWAFWPTRTAALPDPKLEQRLWTMSTQINGMLNGPPEVGIRLGQPAALKPDQWPNLVTYFDIEPLQAFYGDALAPFVVQLAPDHPAHLTGDDWTVVTFGPERHIGYAIQWAAIAAVVALIWIALTLRNRRRSAKAIPL
ncbi:MAG: SURF1 family protein [Pseudomonadota bacterium]